MDEKSNLIMALKYSFDYYNRILPKFHELYNSNLSLNNFMQFNKPNKVGGFAVLLSIVSCVLSLFVLPRFLFQILGRLSIHLSNDIISDIISFSIAILSAVAIITISRNRSKVKYDKTVNGLSGYINQTTNDIFNHYNSFFDSGYQVLPYIYCHPQIIYQFIFYLESCRADTLKEAINCYVSDVNMSVIKYTQMLTLSAAQQAEINSRQAKNMATVSAVASVLSNL